MAKATNAGIFNDTVAADEQVVYIQNEVFTIAFSSRGAQPKWVELKKFKNMDSGHVRLASSGTDRISYAINTGTGSAQTADLVFNQIDSVKNADGSTTISFTKQAADPSAASAITHLRAQCPRTGPASRHAGSRPLQPFGLASRSRRRPC